MVWKDALLLLNLQADWGVTSLDDAFSTWWMSEATKDYRAIPFIISWGIWITRNDLIFKDITKTSSEIAIKAVGIADHFLDLLPKVRFRPILQENINFDMPWFFLMGL